MLGFELLISGVGSERSTNWATTTALVLNIVSFVRWTYAASKGAINILTKTMALDMAGDKIRVNSVSPGWIWSPEVAKAAQPGLKYN